MSPEKKDVSPTLLEELVERSYQKFQGKRSFTGPTGKEEAYFTFLAAEDVIKEIDLDIFELVKRLTEQTTLTPDNVDVEDIFQSQIWDSWDGLKRGLSRVAENIIIVEMRNRYPDIIEEEEEREVLFPGPSWKDLRNLER